MKRKIKISKKDLYRLYRKENKSTIKIANIYNCHPETIRKRLIEFDIPLRYRRIKITKKELERLYHTEKKSTFKIAKIYKCSPVTISNRLRDFDIPLKSKSQARVHYPKYDFDGSLLRKAYFVGFRIGDLRVYKTKPNTETIIVQCHTTQNTQALLLKDMFNKYGKVSIGKQKDGSLDINCYLNETFEFLLPKKDTIDFWIKKRKKAFVAFIAGYIDAEGSFGINQGKARFEMCSYDKNILREIHLWCHKGGIESRFFLIGKKGQLRSNGYRFNSDLWRLNVNDRRALLKFMVKIKPFIKHEKRIQDMAKCFDNIKIREEKGQLRMLQNILEKLK